MMNMKSVTVPVHNKYATYNRSAKGKARRSKYRHDNSKHQTDAAYLSRGIRGWDGEGVTENGTHLYTMLACMDETGEYHSISDARGLSTYQCLEFVARYGDDDRLNVIYGGGYDFNMFLRDFTESNLRALYEDGRVEWCGFRIAWRAGKSFDVRAPGGKNVRIYDVVSFFQSPFVAACDSYLGDAFIDREQIIASKERRGTFTNEEAESVADYNRSELVNLVALVTELRKRLNNAGLRPRRWDGPGAVAAALLAREGVKNALAVTPDPVARAARYAYAGGRFEVIKHGMHQGTAYEYDVNSAYPAALRDVPNLQRGTWVHHDGAVDADFALYRIRWSTTTWALPGPLFSRRADGSVCYPPKGEGWYWTPEYRAALSYEEHGYGTVTVEETWEFVPDEGAEKPFAFIDGLYLKRKALKKAGDGAHVGIKLALNSLYGKLAQQVGWRMERGELRTPPFHQLEWAGYTTSYCRARVLTASMSDLSKVIAFETDAVFTTEPLDVPISGELGDFERITIENLLYVQSGLYFGEGDGNLAKTRGVDRGRLSRSDVAARMGARTFDERVATVSLTRFVGAGIALSQNFARWRTWETQEKTLRLQPNGKRMHDDLACKACRASPAPGLSLGMLHTTMCPYIDGAPSCEYPVEWINPDPAMDRLSDLRNSIAEWE